MGLVGFLWGMGICWEWEWSGNYCDGSGCSIFAITFRSRHVISDSQLLRV